MEIHAEEYFEIKRLEERAAAQGLVVARCKHWHERLALVVRSEPENPNYALPIYSRGSELFTGSVGELLSFLQGWEKRREYEMLLGVNKTLERQETAARHRHTLELLKQQKNKENHDSN
jgi:hypothetical protein